MNRFHQAKNYYANAHKHFFSPLTYILISGDYLDHEDNDKDEKDLLLLVESGVEPKSTALTLLSILVKVWFHTVRHCFKILLGFEQVALQNDDDDLHTHFRVDVVSGIHFSSGNSFSQEEMIDCSFNGGSFVGADFSYAFLTRCDFRNADLRGANFQLAELRECDFTGANLEGANFNHAEGRGVKGLNVHIGEL